MGFKENLLKKMEIDEMTRTVAATIGPVDSGLKVDRKTMRRLLGEGPYEYLRQRDLDLYIDKTRETGDIILVLDNELPMYRSTVEDVALRRSPTVKEMLSIRNAIRILRDADIRISDKKESLKSVRRACIDLLDLSYDQSDITAVENEGAGFLERDYAEGVSETLGLFGELLEYKPLPNPLQQRHHELLGKWEKDARGRYRVGPVAIYSHIDGSLRLVEGPLTGSGKEVGERLAAASSGGTDGLVEGGDVFHFLAGKVKIRPLWPEG